MMCYIVCKHFFVLEGRSDDLLSGSESHKDGVLYEVRLKRKGSVDKLFRQISNHRIEIGIGDYNVWSPTLVVPFASS